MTEHHGGQDEGRYEPLGSSGFGGLDQRDLTQSGCGDRKWVFRKRRTSDGPRACNLNLPYRQTKERRRVGRDLHAGRDLAVRTGRVWKQRR